MKTAALLPTPGDPMLVRYWAANAAQTWRDEVDELLVLVNGQTNPDAAAYLRWLLEDLLDARVTLMSSRIDHGKALQMLLAQTDAQLLLFLEDDAYVRRSGAIAAQFAKLANDTVDVIGSPRGSAHQLLIDECTRRFGEPEARVDGIPVDHGHGLWPSFFFARRQALEQTDLDFSARFWAAGETVPGLAQTFAEDTSADTLTATAYQLRANGARIEHVPQYRLGNAHFMDSWLPHDPAWFHVGSLSSGYGHFFADDAGEQKAIARDGQDDIAFRLSWWQRFAETGDDQLPRLRNRYTAAVEQVIEQTGTRALVDYWRSRSDPWISWDEYDHEIPEPAAVDVDADDVFAQLDELDDAFAAQNPAVIESLRRGIK